MIPAVIPPLSGLSVLVTRPARQAELLAEHIRALGGDAFQLPAIEVRPIAATISGTYELVIFVSANAVEHGAHLIARTETMRIAAIGKATASALAAANLAADIVPERGSTSEALLSHPQLMLAEGTRVLIVRGSGGRELLQQHFAARGCEVQFAEVYERVRPSVDEMRCSELEAHWAAGGIDVVTATSVETLANLMALLSEQGRQLLRATPLVVPSPRVRQAAADMGLCGECLLAAGADDDSIAGALSRWHTRARLPPEVPSAY